MTYEEAWKELQQLQAPLERVQEEIAPLVERYNAGGLSHDEMTALGREIGRRVEDLKRRREDIAVRFLELDRRLRG